MAPNTLPRTVFTNESQSIYETFREYEETSDTSDVEGRAGANRPVQQEKPRWRHGYQDTTSQSAADSPIAGLPPVERVPFHSKVHSHRPARRSDRRTFTAEPDESGDDVPMSLLIEMDDAGKALPPRPSDDNEPSHPSGAPENKGNTGHRAKWNTAQTQQGNRSEQHRASLPIQHAHGMQGIPIEPREKALWRWTNVENLDNFLKRVYDYYIGKGIWSITVSRFLNLLTTAFVVGFSLFLSTCIDYTQLPHSGKMSDIYIEQCGRRISGPTNLLIWFCAVFWLLKLYECLRDLARLKQMHDFYHYLLDIQDIDIQTVSWQDVVRKLMGLRDANPATVGHLSQRHRRFLGTQSKQRMDAHDIANRLMRRENYLIALFNKDILDLTIPLPGLKTRPIYSKTLEWTLSLCILDFIFDDQGQVRSLFMKSSQRKALSEALRRRFFLIGVVNIFVGPLMIAYVLALYFFRNFSEFQKEPSSIGSRQYTPLAEWKFREFNELWHLFERRINMSYPFASRYIDQFPKDKTVQLAKFISFVAGALAAVLAVTTLVDPDLFLGFEITPGRTVIFYLTILTTVWAVARGMIPEEFAVFDPEYAMKSVIGFTHYQPSHWHERLHSDEIRREFSQLYKPKVLVFLEEVLSMLTTPFILCFSLPDCSERIVDFVREFTVHVDGLGYVCSFAVFDFARGDTKQKRQTSIERDNRDLREEYYSAKDGKMLASYHNFMDHYVTKGKRNDTIQPSSAGPTVSQVPFDSSIRREVRATQRHQTQKIFRPHSVNVGTTSQRTPRFSPAAAHASPMSSVLLDPHHQPSSSLRIASRIGTHSKLHQSRPLIGDLLERDEDDLDAGEAEEKAPRQSDTLEDEEHSHLGESWKISKAGSMDDVDDRSRGPATNADNGAGILGLVYQFSKAQTEGRAAGV